MAAALPPRRIRLACSVILTAVFAAAAVTVSAQGRPSGSDPQLDALTKQVDALRNDVEDIKRRPSPPPPEAWKTLGGVGLAFAIAWMIVSLARERARTREAILTAAVDWQKITRLPAPADLASQVSHVRSSLAAGPFPGFMEWLRALRRTNRR